MARYKAPPHVARPIVHDHLDLEHFPQQLEAFAIDVTTFLDCLNEFPEFTDEAVNASILSFEGDLKVRLSSNMLTDSGLSVLLVLGILLARIHR